VGRCLTVIRTRQLRGHPLCPLILNALIAAFGLSAVVAGLLPIWSVWWAGPAEVAIGVALVGLSAPERLRRFALAAVLGIGAALTAVASAASLVVIVVSFVH